MTASPDTCESLPRTSFGDPVGEVGIRRVAQVLEREHGEPLGPGAVVRPGMRASPGEEHAQADEEAEHEGDRGQRHAPRRRSAGLRCRYPVERRHPGPRCGTG